MVVAEDRLGLGLVCGMSYGTYYLSLSSIAAERFHPQHAGQGSSLYLASPALRMFVGAPIWGAIVERVCSDDPDCGAVDRRGHLRLCGYAMPLQIASGPDGRGRTPKGVVLPAFKADS